MRPSTMTMTASPVPVGAVIAGKYRVEKVLGAGAMGVVLAARHMELLELRAIKLMLPAGQQNAEGVERFLREARAAARLKSQYVAKVHDVGRLEDGAPYAVIEYLEGTDLKAVLDQRGTLPVGEAAMYLTQVCEAIGEAHAAGIVHRDLKPANLFLTRGPAGTPIVKVLDFGIAKVAAPDGSAADMTATSAMLGTPLYMSPEQMRGARDVDSRADIWALGVILYRMLTGRTPFSGASLTEICAAVVSDTPPAPRALRPDLSPDVEAVILRCLQKNPAQRFATAAEFAAALGRAAAGAGASTGASAGTSGGQGMSLMGTMLMDPPSAAAHPPAPAGANGTFGPVGGSPGAPPAGANGTFGPMGGNPGAPPAGANGTFGPVGGSPGAVAQGSATFGGGSMSAPVAPGANATFGPQGASGMVAPAQAQASWSGASAWQGSAPAGGAPQPGAPASNWGPPNAASSQATWGAQAPATPPAKSRTGLFVGIGAVAVIGVGAVIAFLAWPSDASSSHGPGGPGAPAQPAAPGAPGAAAQPTSSTTAKPGSRPGTPAFGQSPSPSASPSFGAAPTTPGAAPPPGATTPPAASPSPAPTQTPPPAGASSKSLSALLGIMTYCWKGNEGANKGEPASSATVQVTAGPSRSIIVSGPAKSRSGFTSCVVSKASSMPLDPSDTVVVASTALPAGPP